MLLAEYVPVESNIPEIISRSIHILASIIAVGGTIFMRLLLSPSARESLMAETGEPVVSTLARRWSIVVHTSVAVIIISGLWNAIIMFPLHQGQTAYYGVFAVKLLLAGVMVFFVIALTSRFQGFEGVQQRRSLWLVVSVVVAVLIVVLSNILKTFPVAAAPVN